MADERLKGVITCGGFPTEQDLQQIERFRQFITISTQGERDFGLPRYKARSLAAIEVYGDVNCEGDGLLKTKDSS